MHCCNQQQTTDMLKIIYNYCNLSAILTNIFETVLNPVLFIVSCNDFHPYFKQIISVCHHITTTPKVNTEYVSK